MRLTTIVGLGSGIFLALTIQAALFSVHHLPLASPDLLLVVVAALGFAFGQRTGLVSGFCAGLAADLIPPAAHSIGQQAFVLCLFGYLAGRAAPSVRGSTLRPILFTACLAAASPFLYALLGVVVGTGSFRMGDLVPSAAGSAVYAAILAPFTVPVVQLFASRGEALDISTLGRSSGLRKGLQ